jgi:hypothetical protein
VNTRAATASRESALYRSRRVVVDVPAATRRQY